MTITRKDLRFPFKPLIVLLCVLPFVVGQLVIAKQPITIEDLVTYTRIRNQRLSPDGKWVTYLTLKPNIQENRYDSALFLLRTDSPHQAVELAHFRTTAEQTFVETGAMKNFAGQVSWSSDSKLLGFTKREAGKVQVWIRSVDSATDVKLTGDFTQVDFQGWEANDAAIRFRVTDEASAERASSAQEDPAIRITDQDNFWWPSWVKKDTPKQRVRVYRYVPATHELREAEQSGETTAAVDNIRTYEQAKWPTKRDEIKYANQPILSPDKKTSAFLGQTFYNTKDIKTAGRDYFVGLKELGNDNPPREVLHSTRFISYFQWSVDSKTVYALQFDPEYTAVLAIKASNGEVAELLRTPNYLANASWSADAKSFVAVRQRSLMPDELVRFDLKQKQFQVLANPNASFADKDLPEVRFMRVHNPLGGGIFGRLVLPNGYVKGERYPLIFTTYRAGTGFLEGAVGNEFPIYPYAASGFVVFAMDTGISNMLSSSGDLEFTLMRQKRPIEAMQILIRQLADEGLVDPSKCGVTGLSYGGDIASYASWTTRTFAAASVAGVWLDPITHTLNSVAREKVLAESGLSYPDTEGLRRWINSSLAMNAATMTTPILIQSPDQEALVSLEAFKALKHYGVPVDWYVYPGEGHMKFQPLNKYYVYRRNLDWMNFWLQDKEDPGSAKKEQYARWRAMREEFRNRRY